MNYVFLCWMNQHIKLQKYPWTFNKAERNVQRQHFTLPISKSSLFLFSMSNWREKKWSTLGLSKTKPTCTSSLGISIPHLQIEDVLIPLTKWERRHQSHQLYLTTAQCMVWNTFLPENLGRITHFKSWLHNRDKIAKKGPQLLCSQKCYSFSILQSHEYICNPLGILRGYHSERIDSFIIYYNKSN